MSKYNELKKQKGGFNCPQPPVSHWATQDELVACPVCLEVKLNDMIKLIPCCHTVCMNDMLEIMQNPDPDQRRCPFCRSIVSEEWYYLDQKTGFGRTLNAWILNDS